MTESYPGSPDPWGAPAGGYQVPPRVQGQLTEPLISPDYHGWWSRGLSIAKRGWKPLALLQAVGVGVTLLAQAPVAAYTALASDDFNQQAGTADPNRLPDLAPLFSLFGWTLVALLLALVIAAMVTLASVHIGVSVAVGAEVRVAGVLRLAARRVFPLLGWQLLAIPIYVVAVCLCVVPVFYVAAVFVVLPVVVAVERSGAIGRCFSLFHHDLGSSVARVATIFGLTLAGALVGGVFGAVVNAGALAAWPGTGGIIGGAVVSTLLSALAGGAIAILLAPLTLTAYADMRARHEPLTTMTVAHELGITAPPAESWSPWPPGR